MARSADCLRMNVETGYKGKAISMRFDFYTHGLWILGSVFFFLAALISGNLEFVEGGNEASFLLAVLLAFALYLVAGLMWISAAVNARQEERLHKRAEE